MLAVVEHEEKVAAEQRLDDAFQCAGLLGDGLGAQLTPGGGKNRGKYLSRSDRGKLDEQGSAVRERGLDGETSLACSACSHDGDKTAGAQLGRDHRQLRVSPDEGGQRRGNVRPGCPSRNDPAEIHRRRVIA